MTLWVNDFVYGARMLVKRPGTSAIAIVALALGIGLTAVMFSIVQGAILRGLPFEEGDRILIVSRSRLAEPASLRSVPQHDFVDWRDSQQSFEELAGVSTDRVVVNGDTGFPEEFRAASWTPNMLALLRVQPVIGRDITEADAAPGAPPVALISHRVWTSRFGGDAGAIGQDLRIDGELTSIIGVMPQDFGFPEVSDVWRPITIDLSETRGTGVHLLAVGRLADGVTVGGASAEMAGIARQLAETYPENEGWTASAGPFVHRSLGNDVVATLFTMLGAVFGVMLIACVNVTNLQLARAAERTKEVAIRTALGSTRWRIVRQLLAEGLLLSAVGALLGIGIARAGTALFMWAIVDTEPPFWIDVYVDPTVLLFVTGITVTAALVSSVLPGWRVARADASAALKDETRGATGLRMGLFSRWLVVVEVTASCVLLVVSGLMIKSIVATNRFDYPFATQDVFFAEVELRGEMDEAERGLQLEQLEQRLRSVPGVQRVALSCCGTPVNTGQYTFSLDGLAAPDDGEPRRTGRVLATPTYFDVLRVDLIEGRGITDADRLGSQMVAVVDEDFARRHFPNGTPLGRRIRFGDESRPWATIVGIAPSLAPPVGSVQPLGAVYTPLAQSPGPYVVVLAQTSADPLSLAASVRAAVVAVNDQSPVTKPNSLAGELWSEGWPFRVFGGLFLTFGLAALVLAAAGLYGVMSFTVRCRTEEIGVRMALGARRRSVLGMVLWQGFWRIALGIIIGLVPAYVLGTMMGPLLEGADASDPVVYGATVATLLTAGLLACLAPAMRAASVDPLSALRRD